MGEAITGEGGFPRDALSAGEQLLLEVKPSFVPFLLAPLSALSLLLVVGSIWFFTYAARDLSAAAALCGLGLVFILPLIGLGGAIGYLRWRATVYAVTDRRAVVKTGIIGTAIVDAAHTAVQNVTMVQGAFQRLLGYGTVVFATSGTGGGTAMPQPTAARLWAGTPVMLRGDIVFMGVRDPMALRRRCQELMEAAVERSKEKDYRKMADAFVARGATTQAPAPVVVTPSIATPRKAAKFCEFCGSRIEGAPTFCPRCGGRAN